MTAAEQLWSKAQQGDIHARGELTGQMFQRDLKEFQGPHAPEQVFMDQGPNYGVDDHYRPNYNEYLYSTYDQTIPTPQIGDVHGTTAWNGQKWVPKEELPKGYRQPEPPQALSGSPSPRSRSLQVPMDYLPPRARGGREATAPAKSATAAASGAGNGLGDD